MLSILRNKAQSTAEYAIIIGLVVAVVAGMQTYIKRGMQGHMRDASDRHGQVLGSAAGIGPGSQWAIQTGASDASLDSQFEVTDISARSTLKEAVGSYEKTTMEAGGKVVRDSLRNTQQEKGDYQMYDYTEQQEQQGQQDLPQKQIE